MVFQSHSFFFSFGKLPACFKRKTNPQRRTDLPKMQVDLAPHRHRWCKNTRCIHTPALILAMQPHGGKSCPCGCIARFLHLRFLPLKLVHQHKHMLKIIPFFPPHLIIHPPYCPCIIFHPQRTLPPPPTDYPNARLACIVGVRRWRQREARRRGPNPYNAGNPRVGIVSGRGGEWALGVKYDARTIRGMK